MLDSKTDVTSIRQELPAITSTIYMNTAAFGPLLRLVPQAIAEWLNKECVEGRLGLQTYEGIGKVFTEARNYIARILNANSNEIALTGNTGEGVNIVCNGFNWQPDDEIIMTNHEHISTIIVLQHLTARYGIKVRIADLGTAGDRPAEEAIAPLINSRTRLIIISHISFLTGALLNVKKVAELAHQSNIPVLGDGAQSVGVIPVDVKDLDVDFYAFPMQKWLCGPDGTGALYVRHESLEKIKPTYAGGWFSIQFVGGHEWVFQDAARRFELGGRHTAAVAGQTASLRWLEETVTYPWIFDRIAHLNNYAYQALKSLDGASVLTPKPGVSGLLTVILEGQDASKIAQWLQKEYNIHIRAIFECNGIRLSTSFFNTEDEIDLLATALRKWQTL